MTDIRAIDTTAYEITLTVSCDFQRYAPNAHQLPALLTEARLSITASYDREGRWTWSVSSLPLDDDMPGEPLVELEGEAGDWATHVRLQAALGCLGLPAIPALDN